MLKKQKSRHFDLCYSAPAYVFVMKSLSNDGRWKSTFPEKAQFAMIPKEVIGACSHRALQIYAALAVYRNYKTSVCTPSVNTLANNLNVSASTVKRGLEELCEIGLIEKRARYKDHGGKNSCQYRLLTPWVKNEPSPAVSSDRSVESNNEVRDRTQLTYKQEETNDKNINDTFSKFEELFQAVCDATQIERSTISPGQKKDVDKSVKAFISKQETPDEILRRSTLMRSSWSKGKVTPKSLLNNWDYFAHTEVVKAPEYGIKVSDCPWGFNEDGDALRMDVKQGDDE